MRIHMHRRPAQPAAVDDAGVVQLVAVDRVAFADEGGDRADVGRVAAWERAARLRCLRTRPACVPARRAARLRPVTSGLAPEPQPYSSIAAADRGSDSRIGGQAEVVVGAEIDERLAVDLDPVAALRADARR